MIVSPEGMSQNPYLCFTPALKGVILKGMEEVIGRLGVNAVFNLTGLSYLVKAPAGLEPEMLVPYCDVSSMQDTMEQLYGFRGGHGLALKAGRACFDIALRAYGQQLGLLDLDFRLQPTHSKIRNGMHCLAQFMSEWGESPVRVEEGAVCYRWIVTSCPLCWGRHSDVPICHMQVGMLQQFMYWASGGKNYNVTETECSAMGNKDCVFSIDKVALDY